MNINHSVISGNLVRDPEMRTVGADKVVTSFTIAHNSRYKSADGEQREDVSFIDIEAWGRQGEIAAQYLTKGAQTIVEGRIKQDNWTDKEGQKRSKLKLVADKVHLMPKGERSATDSDVAPAAAAPRRPAPVAQGASGGDDEPPFAICRHLGE